MKFCHALITMMLIASISPAHVQLNTPSGGELYEPGENVEISWETRVEHPQNNWDLYFSPDGGITWEELAIDLPTSQLSYSWNVPDISTSNARIRIVMDNIAENYMSESGDFSINIFLPLILNYPVGSENFLVGSIQEINWEVNGFVSFDFWDLMYSEDGGNTWTSLASNLPQTILSYDWTIPETMTSQGKIKLQMNISGTIYEDVSGNFTISDQIITSLDSFDKQSKLVDAYPNPFKESITFKIATSKSSRLKLIVYNQIGQPVLETIIKETSTFPSTLSWTPKDMPTGIYYYHLQSNKYIDSGKLFYQK